MKNRILTTAVVAMMLMGTASPAMAKGPEADLKTKKTATVVAGDSAWLAINWQAKGGEVTNFKVTAEAPAGIGVTYPENTPGFTGLMNGHVLSEKELDFTALKVAVPYEQTKKFKIKLSVSYTADGKQVEDRFDVTVPVAVYQADQDLAQVADSAGSIPSGESDWVEVDFSGLAPMVEDFEMVISDPAGFTVMYPSARSSASLYFNNVLEDKETDYAAFQVDTAGIAPGSYNLGLRVSYTMAGQNKTFDGTLTLTVTG
jgi:hypothetical protein